MNLVERFRRKPEGKYLLLSILFLAAAIVCLSVGVGLIILIFILNPEMSPFGVLGTTILGPVVTMILFGWLLNKSTSYKAEELVTGICRQAIEEGKEAYWDPKYPRPIRKRMPSES